MMGVTAWKGYCRPLLTDLAGNQKRNFAIVMGFFRDYRFSA